MKVSRNSSLAFNKAHFWQFFPKKFFWLCGKRLIEFNKSFLFYNLVIYELFLKLIFAESAF